MRAKTRDEKWVLAEQQRLPELPARTLEWARANLMREDGFTWFTGAYSKKRRVVWCQNCGHVEHLPADAEVDYGAYVCTECGSTLKLYDGGRTHPKSKTCTHEFIVARTHRGWQVFEGVDLDRTVRIGERPEYRLVRRYAIWINGRGKEVITACSYSRGCCGFKWLPENGWMIARHNGIVSGYFVYDDMFDISGMRFAPGGRYLPELRRRGWRPGIKEIDALSAEAVCSALLRSSVAETLMKTGRWALLSWLVSEGKGNRVERYWASVKIALRHGMRYGTKEEVGLWLDYLTGLYDEGRDMRSPKWLLPEDLRMAHSAQVRRAAAVREANARRRQIEEDREFDAELAKRTARAAGVAIADGNIEIVPLRTIKDFYDEGNALHHCVFSMGYYKHKDCLILGARVNGQRTETIEVSLKNFSVVQCRGSHNMDSPFHERIMRLMESSLGRIRAAYRRAQ